MKKFAEIAVLTFCKTSDNALGFCLVLSETYSQYCETPSMKCFPKIANGWAQSTIFAKSFILDVSLGSQYVSDYPEVFSIITEWDFLSNLSSILLKYLKQKFSR